MRRFFLASSAVHPTPLKPAEIEGYLMLIQPEKFQGEILWLWAHRVRSEAASRKKQHFHLTQGKQKAM